MARSHERVVVCSRPCVNASDIRVATVASFRNQLEIEGVQPVHDDDLQCRRLFRRILGRDSLEFQRDLVLSHQNSVHLEPAVLVDFRPDELTVILMEEYPPLRGGLAVQLNLPCNGRDFIGSLGARPEARSCNEGEEDDHGSEA